jgi:hypothetical protein
LGFIKKLFNIDDPFKNADENQQDWIKLFTSKEYKEFIKTVSFCLSEQKIDHYFKDGYVYRKEDNSQFNLRNLAQTCLHSNKHDWKKIIEEHFRNLQIAFDETKKQTDSNASFSKIANNIAVRIWPSGTLEEIGRNNCIVREQLEGTATFLVLDSPESIRNVQPSEVNNWGKDINELFDMGLQNVKKQCNPDIYTKTLAGNINVTVIASNNFFTASLVLELENYPELIGTHGTIVGIPHRHVIVCYPIENMQVVQAINQLLPIVNDLYKQGPGSISPNLYWRHEKMFTAILYNEEGKKLYIPPVFAELLNHLA